MPSEETARHASERFGVEVTERHVSRIVRHVSGVVRDALVASGEMSVRARTEAEAGEERRTAKAWDPLKRVRAEVMG